MKRLKLLLATSLALVGVAAISFAADTTSVQPAAAPASQPARLTLDQLREISSNAFEANDYATALPLLKDLSVRLRNDPRQVAPLLEQIRVCEANLALSTPIEGINAPRHPHVKPAEGAVYEVELQKLGNFTYDADKGQGIPDDVKALNGCTVKLTGFMRPLNETEKITRFVLVPDLFACCFGQPPQLQHTAIVVCPDGKAVNYFPDRISVQGVLKVAEQSEEGFVLAIFEVSATSIRPVVN